MRSIHLSPAEGPAHASFPFVLQSFFWGVSPNLGATVLYVDLPKLERLSLLGNLVQDKAEYRPLVLQSFPHLRRLDERDVPPEH